MKELRNKMVWTVCTILFIFGITLCISKNNVQAAERSIATNAQWVNGSVENDVDFWKFSIPSAGRVTFTFQSYSGDGQCSLKDADLVDTYNYAHASGSSTNPDTDEKSSDLEAGTYYLKIHDDWSESSNWTGNYRIKVAFSPANNTEKEPNNSFDTAMSLGKDCLVRGFLSKTDSIDFYKITVSKPQTIHVIYNFSNEFILSVWNSDLIALKEDSNWSSDRETGTHEWEGYLQPGTYYLKVREGYNSTGSYTLKFGSKQYVSSVKLKSSKVALTKGKKYSLLNRVLPSDANNKSLSWESSDTSVATVSATGVVKAKKPGSTTITAKSQDGSDVQASAVVIVKPGKAVLKTLRKHSYLSGRAYAEPKSILGVSGYQFAWSKTKSFKKKKTFSTYSGMYVSLKKKKTYYFKVRAYVEYNRKRYYGAWSKARKIKLK